MICEPTTRERLVLKGERKAITARRRTKTAKWSRMSDARMQQRIRDIVEYDTNGGCWFWPGSAHKFGYGKVNVGGRSTGAHRFAWRAFKGDIPAGMDVCHRCDTPPCVNPGHLFLGTPADNVSDMIQKGRGDNRKGGLNPAALLTEAQVAAIIAALALKVPGRQLAARYGVTPATISDIKHGRSWPSVSRPWPIESARRAMSPARKRRIHAARDGLCRECGLPVPVSGKGVVYDHFIQLAIGGLEADENVWPVHKACDTPKTAKDAATRAKVVRIQKRRAGEEKAKRPIPSRGFAKSDTPRPIAQRADPWPKRSFPSRSKVGT